MVLTSRFWCGPHDPDPIIAQIGAVKISLEDDFTLSETKRIFVKPFDRDGNPYELDPLFVRLTGISEEVIADAGVTLGEALRDLDVFAAGAKFWSWGKDEFNMIAISCYVANIAPVIPATRFGNACHLLLKAGMSYEDMKTTRSNTLADYYAIEHPPLNAHVHWMTLCRWLMFFNI